MASTLRKLVVAGLLLSAHPPIRLSAAQHPGIDVTTYRFLIDLPDTGSSIRGIATVLFRRLRNYDDTLRLDLVGMSVDRVFDISTIERVPFTHDGAVLKIHARRAAGVMIEYHGTPADGLIYRAANARGRRSFFADNWPSRARHWLPTNDHPSDKARVMWSVRAPAGMRVVMNARDCRVTCRESAPIPTYAMVIGATQMTVSRHHDAISGSDTIPVEVWAYPEDSVYADTTLFRHATPVLEALARIVGPFPYSRLAHVQSSTRYGGMENASAIFYNETRIIARTITQATVRHEIAHQWFGDAVTEADWHEVWLSEGFASYFNLIAGGAVHGDSVVTRGVPAMAAVYLASKDTARPIIDSLLTDPMTMLNANTYQKGAAVLHMLRLTVGEPAFFQGIRDYYRMYRDSAVTSLQFQRRMEAASRMDLGWFFRQWLYQPGYPRLDARIEDGALVVRQVQPAEWGTYRIDGLPVEPAGPDGCRRMSIRLAATWDAQRFPIPGCRAASAVVDPERAWLVR